MPSANQIDKPCIVTKTLGGRAKITPREGFRCACKALKKLDCVAVGMHNEQSVAYDVEPTWGIMG